ncbi:MAG TPA: single-stranded-DNA-specific exonuclease RecJ [Ruminococcaceae bacterium]|nr:single-stranded-DNA-specific exonuclease RecJ [Oscillospiraceae bacterium]
MSRKKWIVKSGDKEYATKLSEELGISPYAALIASTRGIKTAEEAKDFFGIGEHKSVDPMDFPDMYAAVKRVQKALDEFERIAVYGDYDADGVTSTALLYSYLEMQGADVVYYVPNRHTEGYGLSYEAIDKLSMMGVKLIITVDNGISAVEEAKYINELEMDLVITDHHLPSDSLPQAAAVVDPHRADCNLDFKDYAGVGVAYKLICALEGEENGITDSFVDLVTIGTIADVMPLVKENREFVRRGVEMLADSDRTGIQALMEAAGLSERKINSTSIAFGICPRINAAGRMGSADRAIRLLLSEDYDEAVMLAQEINDENTARQQTEQEILTQADEQIRSNPGWKYQNVLVVAGEGWHDGVVGIVASRLVEKYGKPTLVITVDGEDAKGSGRSIEGFNLYDAICRCGDCLTHFGGHMLAAGIGLKASNIPVFRQKINKYADSIEMPYPIQNIDFKLNPACVNTEMLETVSQLEPFGAGNPQPIFGLYNMTVADIQPIGNGKHLRVILERNGISIQTLKFRTLQADFPFVRGDIVDAAVGLEPNEYLGQLRVSVLLKNIKLHDMVEDDLFSSMRDFSMLMRGRKDGFDAELLIPQRETTAKVYRYIRSAGRWNYDIETLCHRLDFWAEDYGQVAVSVEAMLEMGILRRDENEGLSVPKTSEKVNLQDAPILRRLAEISNESAL